MWTEKELDRILTTPSAQLIADMAKIEGDIMVLGAGGKMGPTLAVLAQNARSASKTAGRVFAVSRFSEPEAADYLARSGVEVLPCDLLADGALDRLPDVPNILYMAGRKFGTTGQEADTWALNAALPALVGRRFCKSRLVVFSTGNVYPLTDLAGGGCSEDDPTGPVGEYAMSCLARERLFEHAAQAYGSKVLIYRLNYAVDLRYGVLHDIAAKILAGEPISQKTPCFNCVWQGYANEVAIRGLLLADSPAVRLNVTGPETVSVRHAARLLGEHLGRRIVLLDDATDQAYLNQAGRCMSLFGYPQVSADTLIRWQAEWLLSGGRSHNKPTHFDEREGQF